MPVWVVRIFSQEFNMKVCCFIAMIFALSVSTAAFAAKNVETLYKDGNCNNCHTIEDVTSTGFYSPGPSLVKVADKYRGDKEAQEKLEKKVRSGGAGSWGVMPMPGTRQSISDQDIKILVAWILEQKAKPKAAEKSDAKTDKKSK
jgi:cytochrome c